VAEAHVVALNSDTDTDSDADSDPVTPELRILYPLSSPI
jgi:hypothetical protein